MKPKTLKPTRGDSDVVRLLKAYRDLEYKFSKEKIGTDLVLKIDKASLETCRRIVLEINEVIKKIG